jgi:hypothetical protein
MASTATTFLLQRRSLIYDPSVRHCRYKEKIADATSFVGRFVSTACAGARRASSAITVLRVRSRPGRTMQGTSPAQMANSPAQQFATTAEYLFDSSCGLFSVVFYQFPVRVYLKSRLFTICFDEDLVVPPAIGIVFP